MLLFYSCAFKITKKLFYLFATNSLTCVRNQKRNNNK